MNLFLFYFDYARHREQAKKDLSFGQNQKASTEYESSRNAFTSNVFTHGLRS